MKKSVKTMRFMMLAFAGLALAACNASNDTADNSTPGNGASTGKAAKEIVMYKSPGCECCTGWADHLRGAGFTVIEKKREDMRAIKAQYGVPDQLASCHTAIIDGYVIEGHVPAADVQRLLEERPKVAGLTAPGMPKQSPGMQDKSLEPKNYDVLAFDKNGAFHVFTHY